MSKAPVCESGFSGDTIFYQVFADPDRQEYMKQVLPFHIGVEITSKCAGSCAYCFSNSDLSGEFTLPTEKVFQLIDEAVDLGCKMIVWYGGEVLMHPQWYDFFAYSSEKGLLNTYASSAIISKQEARRLCELQIDSIVMHIDTIHPETYNQVHTVPKTLDAKIQGYRNLLEAGYPRDKVQGCLTLSKPVASRLEETVDWFLDDMGASFVIYVILKAAGYGKSLKHFEPSLQDVRRAVEYRALKLKDENLLRIGSSDGSHFICRTHFGVKFDGRVVPCLVAPDYSVGNLFENSLREIFDQYRDQLLFNFQVKGYCGTECENRDVCFGCRATAYNYTGDVEASDPKCWKNPQATEYCYEEASPVK